MLGTPWGPRRRLASRLVGARGMCGAGPREVGAEQPLMGRSVYLRAPCAVRNATAKLSKQRNVFDVTACIDVSEVNVTDKYGSPSSAKVA
jgi:hypothetical protein